MVFSSKIFIALLLIVLVAFYAAPQRRRVPLLLVASYIFYGFWTPWLCSLLMLSTVVDFYCAQHIHQSAEKSLQRKIGLWVSLAVNLGALGFFKYHDFFVYEFTQVMELLGVSIDPERHMLHLVLPVGISFYTFQTLGYTIDVYRGDLQPETKFSRFALFVSFFPQLVAGPVERAPHLLPQFSRPFRIDVQMVREGIFLILLGFIKKSVLADRIAESIAPQFDGPIQDGPLAAMSMLLFTCQIYLDFSSYSDIAIGLGRILGFNIRPNFNLPFVVPSIPERWRRWHISMSHWFRDYIFIPLGGSRGGIARTQINILFLMFLSGLWHGASRNFVVWGLGNGLSMVSHKLIRSIRRPIRNFMERHWALKYGYFYAASLLTFALISTINIFFRSPDWPIAESYVASIFGQGLAPYVEFCQNPSFAKGYARGLVFILFTFTVHEMERYWSLQKKILLSPRLWTLTCVVMYVVILFTAISGPEFIYFQF